MTDKGLFFTRQVSITCLAWAPVVSDLSSYAIPRCVLCVYVDMYTASIQRLEPLTTSTRNLGEVYLQIRRLLPNTFAALYFFLWMMQSFLRLLRVIQYFFVCTVLFLIHVFSSLLETSIVIRTGLRGLPRRRTIWYNTSKSYLKYAGKILQTCTKRDFAEAVWNRFKTEGAGLRAPPSIEENAQLWEMSRIVQRDRRRYRRSQRWLQFCEDRVRQWSCNVRNTRRDEKDSAPTQKRRRGCVDFRRQSFRAIPRCQQDEIR